MSSSSNQSQGSQSKRKYRDFCSTPVLKKPRKLSASESTIGTHSSSSAKETNKEQKLRRDIRKDKKKKRIKKIQVKKRATKEKYKNKPSDEWETTDAYNETLSHVNDPDKDASCKDVSSPEHIREAPRLVQNFFESPTLRSTYLPVESPEKIIVEEIDTLPSKDLPSVNVPLDDTDDEEEALILNRENVVKSYLGIRDKKRSKKEISIDKTKQWLVNVQVPTTSSDLLWDEFLKNNVEKVNEYLPTPSKPKRKSSSKPKFFGARTIRFEDPSSSTTKECCKDKNAMVHEFGLHIPQHMNIARGHFSSFTQKWVRSNDVYTFPQPEDE